MLKIGSSSGLASESRGRENLLGEGENPSNLSIGADGVLCAKTLKTNVGRPKCRSVTAVMTYGWERRKVGFKSFWWFDRSPNETW